MSDPMTADWFMKAKSQRSYLSDEICTFLYWICVYVSVLYIRSEAIEVISVSVFLETYPLL